MPIKLVLLTVATVSLFAASLASAGAQPLEAKNEVEGERNGSSETLFAIFKSDRLTISLEGETIVRVYEHKLPDSSRTIKPLIGEHVVHETGVPGCVFQIEEHFEVDQLKENEAFVSREISHNPKTCEMLLEQAIVDQEWLYIEDGNTIVAQIDNKGAPQTRTSAYRSEYFEARYEDPIDADVARIRVKLSWSYNQSCVTNSWNHTVDAFMLTQTGWHQDSGWYSFTQNCWQAKTTAHNYTFHNPIFCDALGAAAIIAGSLFNPWFLAALWIAAQPDTYTRFNPMKIIGEEDGSYWASGAATKWGGCASLLSYQNRFVSF